MNPPIKPNSFFIFLSPAQIAESHKHGSYELVYVLAGECSHTIDNQTHVMSKGDYVLLDLTSNHCYHSIGDEELAIINCLFFPSFFDASLSDDADIYTLFENYHFKLKKELFIQRPSGTIFKDTTREIERMLTVMNNEFLDKNTGFVEIIRANLIQLLMISMRSIYSDVKASVRDDTIQNILEYINTNYMKDITLKEICTKYNYTLPYISAKFKKVVGVSFMEYLQKARIDKSKTLLYDTNYAISDIAYMVGYKDVRFYHKIFKKHTGKTPGEFKKLAKSFTPDKYRFTRRKYKKI